MTPDHPAFYLDILSRAASQKSELDGCCVYLHIDTYHPDVVEMLRAHQWKVDGSMCMLLSRGSVKLRLNTDQCVMMGSSTMSMSNASLVQFQECSKDLDIHILAYSPAFLQEVNISFTSISGQALMGRRGHTLDLMDEEVEYLKSYFHLIHSVMSNYLNLQLARHTVSSLTAALFYQMVEVIYKRLEVETTTPNGAKRQLSYVHDFIKLVHLHFMKERMVNFYAEKLFISPKYLSLLVKEATGRSAAQWIDHHVIIEAKNLLRYSGKNIQQVAYALNFSNQSAFGKYFKHLTGMSPTEYQKS